MYEMLAGTMPFRGETAVEIALKHIKEPMPSVRKVNPKVPQSLENVILKATAKNPKNRYNNVRELYDDLKTTMSPERADEKRIVFKYPENDIEDTKVMNTLKDELNKNDSKEEKEDKIVVKSVKNDEYTKKMSKTTKFLIGACLSIILIFIVAIFIVPALTRKPDVVVPDVTGLTIKEATDTLQKKKFKVSPTIKKDYTDEVKKGKVSKTEPVARKTVKKGATVILYKSLGSEKIKINDYTGQDYNKIKAELEVKGLDVSVDKKDVDDKSKYIGKENLIIDQSSKKDTILLKNDSITLFIPNILKEYPDFVKEGWSLKEVQDFCNEYKINVSVTDEINDSVDEGTVIYQSRSAGSDIIPNTTLKIKVSKKTPTDSDDGSNMVPYENEEENQ